jgi:hypothetical protein
MIFILPPENHKKKKLAIMPLFTDHCSKLAIELLPEFGWSIKDEPVYGPGSGSVFQGMRL